MALFPSGIETNPEFLVPVLHHCSCKHAISLQLLAPTQCWSKPSSRWCWASTSEKLMFCCLAVTWTARQWRSEWGYGMNHGGVPEWGEGKEEACWDSGGNRRARSRALCQVLRSRMTGQECLEKLPAATWCTLGYIFALRQSQRSRQLRIGMSVKCFMLNRHSSTCHNRI